MKNIFYGTAIIDDHFYLIKEDDNVGRMFKHDMYSNFLECIFEEDAGLFQNTMNRMTSSKETDETVVLRLLVEEGQWKRFYVLVHLEDKDSEKGRKLFTLKFSDIDAMYDSFEVLQNRNMEYASYLNMLGAILLSYDMEAKILHVFTNVDHRNVFLFEGAVNQWNDFLSGQYVKDSSQKMFHEFCDALENGKTMTCEIMTNAFTNEPQYQKCVFKCEKLSYLLTKKRVVGCIVPKESAADVGNLLGAEYTYDVGIPVLNKKSITDFGRRQMENKQGQVHLVILDLDNFKAVNDVYGHMMGDEVLSIASEIIKKDVGNLGMVGRIGGDEILIVLDKPLEHLELRNVLRSIRTDIEMAFREKLPKAPVTCTAGIAQFPGDGHDFDDVFQIADRMLLRAKEKGKNRYIIYNPQIHGTFQSGNDFKENEIVENVENMDKNHLLQDMIEQYLLAQCGPTDGVLAIIAKAFDLDEVLLVSHLNNNYVQWKDGKMNYNVSAEEYFKETDEFYRLFGEKHEFVMNGYHNFEGTCQEIQAYLKSKKISTAIFSKISVKGVLCGYLMFAKGQNGRKWSDYDVTYLGAVGKIIDLGNDRRW